MKKLLALSMILFSFFSYAQEYKLKKIKTITYVKEYVYDIPKDKYYSSISLGVSPYGNVYYEMRRKQKEDGFGIDIYKDKVTYPDDFYFWNKNFSETDKFILSSNKRFGIGIYYVTPPKYGFNLFIGVGYLHYYLPSSLLNISHNLAINPHTSTYGIIGFTEEIRITERFHLEMKGTFRNLKKYSTSLDDSRVTNFEPSMGIRYDINIKK